MRRLLLLPVMLTGVILFFVHIDLGLGSVESQLYRFAHLAFFAFMAWGLSTQPSLSRRPFLLQVIIIISAVFLLGGMIELTQPYFGRSASWWDLGVDLVGGLIGIMLFSAARRGLRPWHRVLGQFAAVSLATLVLYGPVITIWDMWQASRQFPVLSDFESRFEAQRWSSGRIDRGVAHHGRSSLRVFLPKRKYPGTTLKRSLGDWRGYSAFAFSLYNPDPEPLSITVSIRDEEHSRRGGQYADRFNRTFTIEQGWKDVFIPVADIEKAPLSRTLDLGRLSAVVIFTVSPPSPRLMYLDYVRLIP